MTRAGKVTATEDMRTMKDLLYCQHRQAPCDQRQLHLRPQVRWAENWLPLALGHQQPIGAHPAPHRDPRHHQAPRAIVRSQSW